MSGQVQASILPVISSTTGTYVTVSNVRVKLNEMASCNVTLYDSNNILIRSQHVVMTPDQYSAWGSGTGSDNYFVQTVLANAGYDCPTGPF